MRLGLVGGIAALLLPSLAAAQAAPRIVVLAPDGIREELCAALAVELSARGAAISQSRDADAGDFVVSLRRSDGSLGMELTSREGNRTVSIPRLDASDPRSLAVVAASLLDEVRGLSTPEPRPPPSATPDPPTGDSQLATGLDDPNARADGPPPPDGFFADGETGDPDPSPEAEERPEHSALFGASLGGMFLFNTDVYAPGGGPTTRARVGYRFRNLFRAAVSLTAGLSTQEDAFPVAPGLTTGIELQPLLMPCLELSLTSEITPISIHFGAKGCAFLQRWRYATGLAFSGFFEDLSTGVAFGGFVAGSVYVASGYALWLRADLAGAVPDAFDDHGLASTNREAAILGEVSLSFVIE